MGKHFARRSCKTSKIPLYILIKNLCKIIIYNRYLAFLQELNNFATVENEKNTRSELRVREKLSVQRAKQESETIWSNKNVKDGNKLTSTWPVAFVVCAVMR